MTLPPGRCGSAEPGARVCPGAQRAPVPRSVRELEPRLPVSPAARRDGRALVRLRAHLDSRVRVPDLADTVRPATESNCAGAIPPGGKQLEVNDQSVTRSPVGDKVNSIRSAVLASLRAKGRSPNKIVLPALRKWIASGREPQMVGDRMIGSPSDVNQGTTAGGERAGRGQSPRSSVEAGNDRGAKGDRDVVLGVVGIPSQKGLGSAARLCAWMHRRTGLGVRRRPDSGPPVNPVSGARACAAGATLPKALSREPEPVHQRPRTGKPDAGEPPVRFGWGATEQSVLYPHRLHGSGSVVVLVVAEEAMPVGEQIPDDEDVQREHHQHAG